MTTPTTTFQTPSRILIPKLVKSRDAWKDKATKRKAQRKALEVRVRDLNASRAHHRQHAQQLQEQVNQLQTRVVQLEQLLATAPQPAPTPSAPKK